MKAISQKYSDKQDAGKCDWNNQEREEWSKIFIAEWFG
jgi:hypothetical protein